MTSLKFLNFIQLNKLKKILSVFTVVVIFCLAYNHYRTLKNEETMDSIRPRVGVGVMVLKEGKALMGKRKSAHGAGEYAWPGGHMEHMESFEACAKREVREETGLEIKNIRFLRLLNFKDHAPKHYVDIALVAEWESGEAKVMEPEKCESWGWYELDNLPKPLFGTIPSYLEAYDTGKTFF